MTGAPDPTDRSVVAIPIANLMRTAWLSGFGTGISTMLGAQQGMSFQEAQATATELVTGFDNDAEFTQMVVEEIDAIMMEQLPRLGMVLAGDAEAAARESQLIVDTVRKLAGGDQ